MKKSVIIIVILTAFIFNSCNDKEEKKLPKAFDYGKIENDIYKNNFFDFSFTYPSEWSILDKKESNTLANESIDEIVKDEKLKSKINVSMVNVATLFSAIKKPIDRNTEFTPSLLINCENISKYNGNMSVVTYAEQAKKIMKQAEMAVSFRREEMKTIGGKDFLKLTIENNTYGIAIKQEYYITIINDFAINIIVSYVADENKTIITNSLNTLKFN